MDEIEKQFVL